MYNHRFMINQAGYYFELRETAQDLIEPAYLRSKGCEFYDTEVEMHRVVCKRHNLEMDEVYGNNIIIAVQGGDTVLECDSRGCWASIDHMDISLIDAFLVDYEL